MKHRQPVPVGPVSYLPERKPDTPTMLEPRSPFLVLLLWAFFGVFGAHRAYMGNYKYAALLFFTFGGFLLLWLVDVLLVWEDLDKINKKNAQR